MKNNSTKIKNYLSSKHRDTKKVNTIAHYITSKKSTPQKPDGTSFFNLSTAYTISMSKQPYLSHCTDNYGTNFKSSGSVDSTQIGKYFDEITLSPNTTEDENIK